MAHSLAGGAYPLRCCPSPSSAAAPQTTIPTHPRPIRLVLASISSPPAAPAIEGRGVGLSVTTRRGRVLPVLNGCYLNFPQGQLWMLLGPNGCGKSTLLKCIEYFGEPFLFLIHDGEALSDIKVRIQKRLQVPDEYFLKKQKLVYGGWEHHLGLEHTATTPKRSYLISQNRHPFEKAVKIYN